MASNYPQPNRNHFWTVGILVAVIAGLCGVIALLLLRGGKEAPKAEKEPAATPTPLTAPWWDDAYLRNLSDELLILEDNMQAYLEGVPEFGYDTVQLEDGKLQLAGNVPDENNDAAQLSEGAAKLAEGEQKLADALAQKENVELVLSARVAALLGDEAVTGVTVEQNGATRDIPVEGVFVAVGQQPDNGAFADFMDLDARGYAASGEDCRTRTEGLFVAGDCRAKGVHQLTTAVADGAVAALAACAFLDRQG